ncbi:MAG TPA: aldehyde dehydrogenase (NADP(+)) [Acidobacteriaceae bacterium]|jgi:NADP-dependent aldehyde dehydrogenase
MGKLDGSNLIGSEAVRRDSTFAVTDRTTGAFLEPSFGDATTQDVEKACELASAAFNAYRGAPLETRKRFLETIAQNILDLGDELITRAMAESGLPRPRLEGERGRTVGQLRLFADVAGKGEWLGLRIDPALPERTPLPRVDLRLRHIPLGPVAVFGASNFPLAFSVAGGDTASALAAGCPVVVKGHPAHPGTSELVGRAIQAAVTACGLPEGVFSLLQGRSNALGAALVTDPRIKAVGFTGSRGGGLALVALAAGRPEPIPVYAEMSSVNPVVLFPEALSKRAEALATGFVGSLTLGAGQFCTNPGVVIGVDGPELEQFVVAAGKAVDASKPSTMLTEQIQANYDRGVEFLEGHEGTKLVARGCVGEGLAQGRGALFQTSAKSLLADPKLADEVFGASSLVVACQSLDEVEAVLASMEGQLTITLQMEEGDMDAASRLLPLLETKAGRILVNGWPTGVEVAPAMVHGGPFPATSDSRTTSVGTLAIERFLRPVCYQAMPQALLPPELQDSARGIQRRMDGVLELA